MPKNQVEIGVMKTYLGVDVGTTGVKASFFDREGNLRAQSYLPSRLYYPASGLVEQKPDVYEKTAKFSAPSAYIAGKFAGLKADSAFIDYTCLHFTNLADNRNKAWSMLSCRSVVDGLWYSLAYINGGGLCIEWFAEEFGISTSDKEAVCEAIQ